MGLTTEGRYTTTSLENTAQHFKSNVGPALQPKLMQHYLESNFTTVHNTMYMYVYAAQRHPCKDICSMQLGT